MVVHGGGVLGKRWGHEAGALMNERFYNRDPKDPSSPILPSEDTERRQLSTNQEADLTDAEFH